MSRRETKLYADARTKDKPYLRSNMHVSAGDITTPDAPTLLDITNGICRDAYLESIGFHLFDWQRAVLRDQSTRITICGARQSGKSTILSGVCCHTAKYRPKTLSVILAPTKLQASEDIGKVRDFIARDPHYPEVKRSGSEEIVLANGSRILVLTATDTAARGFSQPAVILFDEASRIDDSVYDAVRPMITGSKTSIIYEISTPFGRKGFFYDHFSRVGSQEKKIRRSRYLVKAPWQVVRTSGKPRLERIPLEAIEGVHCYFSPRHEDETEQLEALDQMKEMQYRQEYGCEFVDAEDQVFRQDLIDDLFSLDGVEDAKPLTDPMDLFEQAEPARIDFSSLFGGMGA